VRKRWVKRMCAVTEKKKKQKGKYGAGKIEKKRFQDESDLRVNGRNKDDAWNFGFFLTASLKGKQRRVITKSWGGHLRQGIYGTTFCKMKQWRQAKQKKINAQKREKIVVGV